MTDETIDVFVDEETGRATVNCDGYVGEACQKDLAVFGAILEAFGMEMDVLSSEKKRPDWQREVDHAKTKVKT